MDIIRVEETTWYNLFDLNIFGLRLKDVNEGTESLEDPMMLFLRKVLTAIPCAAQMSSEALQRADQGEYFSRFYPRQRFIETRMSIYSHISIYTGDDEHGVYFPRFYPDDLDVADESGKSFIEDYLLPYDQPIFYLGAEGHAGEQLQELVLHPPASSKQYTQDWLDAVTQIVPVVLAGGSDESYYHAYTRSREHFKLLTAPIAETEAAIKASAWYQANAEHLVWSDDEWEWCLTYECGSHEHHEKCK